MIKGQEIPNHVQLIRLREEALLSYGKETVQNFSHGKKNPPCRLPSSACSLSRELINKNHLRSPPLFSVIICVSVDGVPVA